jgi:hypothetical protein
MGYCVASLKFALCAVVFAKFSAADGSPGFVFVSM